MREATTTIYLNTLFHDAGIVELRHISNAGRVASGLFHNPNDLIGAARHHAGNLPGSVDDC